MRKQKHDPHAYTLRSYVCYNNRLIRKKKKKFIMKNNLNECKLYKLLILLTLQINKQIYGDQRDGK